ncbi:DUF1850 domain-containing protein [Geminicoccus roseus]|uniref:DUF1850 domain-containing protein n=1 Tax=Geminicoccus roseus TaxID=404900 RepID=UPI0003FD231F|nr:DUF1850 domain-containing protein [Geminicoccus roseus]
MADPLTICLALGSLIVDLGVTQAELRWSHSVQKTLWTERWQATPAGLVPLEASIQGSGAGMDPPDDAVRTADGWRWRPDLPPLPELVLARSGATADWQICRAGSCASITEITGKPADGEPARLAPCAGR